MVDFDKQVEVQDWLISKSRIDVSSPTASKAISKQMLNQQLQEQFVHKCSNTTGSFKNDFYTNAQPVASREISTQMLKVNQ
ncbi:hypothetical protein L6452_38888 [Arctium lappa]|uniref:Uncharacterized protein n=1 Tax=Arctium lappa TaxID=4217 RepID=A0ACB8XRZ6_ARCLA|nr:hypothetical protein L6452_38888 [Arctium lappa]